MSVYDIFILFFNTSWAIAMGITYIDQYNNDMCVKINIPMIVSVIMLGVVIILNIVMVYKSGHKVIDLSDLS